MNTNTAAVGLLVPPMWFRYDHAERHALLSTIAAAGIDHLAVGDHVSFITGAGFDGLTHATALLVSQPTLPVHLAVYLLALRHPVPTARTLATIAELAPGRLTLGVGVGGEDPHELEICGVDPGTRGARLDEALHLVRRLLTGESISHAGRHFSVRDATIVPPPVPPVPVLVGGRSDAALARAGRLGDGWLGIWVSPQRFAEAVARTAEAAAAAGRPRPVAHELNVWCGIDRDAGAARARLAAAMEGLYATPFERFERYSPAGSPEQVAEFLAGYVDAGCQSFNLIVADDEPARVVDAAVEVRTALKGLIPAQV
jgi:alkanesulfonate monooxygenase SsuD/methylene tetrahydromethanopterin reductase-like flavin-dependent oxidoreductase (luciferase family)